MSWYGDIANGSFLGKAFGIGQYDPSNPYRNALQANAEQQTGFGQNLQQQYLANQAGIGNTMGMLQGLAQGQNSVSMEQARQNMQQAQAQQMSMAAGAAPQNSAMAARNAANNMGQLSYGIAGQQSLAGLQERQAALNALSQMQMQQAQQNLTGAGQFGQLGNYAYGTNLQNPQQGWGSFIGGAVGGGVGAAAKFA
jgi:hypothetical protein